MLKLLFPSLAILCFVATCFAQTFQYSHGWTNGKRAFLNAQRGGSDTPDIFVIQQDGDRQLERCLLQLQYFLRNPLQIGAGVETLTPTNIDNNNKQPPIWK